MQDNAFIKQS